MIINKKISPILYPLSPNRSAFTRSKAGGFTLIEAATALIILAFICGGVLVVINRSLESAADSAMKMQAFEVARENMEKLLAGSSVKQTVEYGTSDMYPGIEWQTVVEAFYEPITQRMWVRGICSAEYTDIAGQKQTVELTHWLTDVTKQQMLEILEQQQQQEAQIAVLVLGTVEQAAEYAGVDVPTIQKWVDNGLLTTKDGSFIKKNVDIFKESNGTPTAEVKSQQVESPQELTQPTPKQIEPAGQKPSESEQAGPKTPESKPTSPEEKKVYTADDLRKMGCPEELIPMVLRLLNSE